MKANLITQLNQVTIRDYSLLEDEGICSLVAGSTGMGNPGIIMTYEDDEENPGKHIIIVTAPSLGGILEFLDQTDIPVKILT